MSGVSAVPTTATVSGEAPDGAPVSDEDSAEVVEFIPSLDVQITGYRGQDGGASCPGSGFLQATNGTPATFCLRVENNGTTNLNALTLSVDSLGIAPVDDGEVRTQAQMMTELAQEDIGGGMKGAAHYPAAARAGELAGAP